MNKTISPELTYPNERDRSDTSNNANSDGSRKSIDMNAPGNPFFSGGIGTAGNNTSGQSQEMHRGNVGNS
jgi:hypothetical protein